MRFLVVRAVALLPDNLRLEIEETIEAIGFHGIVEQVDGVDFDYSTIPGLGDGCVIPIPGFPFADAENTEEAITEYRQGHNAGVFETREMAERFTRDE